MQPQTSIPKNTSSTVRQRTKSRRILLDWLNLPDPLEQSAERFWRRHPEVLRPLGKHGYRVLAAVRRHLRNAWAAEDARAADWFLTVALVEYARSANAFFWLSPALPQGGEGFFHEAIGYARRHIGQMLVCRNPDCLAKYRFRKQRSQRYCGADCFNEKRSQRAH